MKIEKSPLELKSFYILQSDLKFIPSKRKIKAMEVFEQYPIDLDYSIRPIKDELFNVFMKVSINNENEKLPGCSIFAEGVGIFRLIQDEALQEKDFKHLLNFSAVSIMINSIRSYILSLTSFCPMGKYILPAIDMNNLMKQKFLQIKAMSVQEPESKYPIKTRKRKS